MANFNEVMDELISERISTLFEIERTIYTGRYNLSKKHKNLLAAQSISMIYSLWEGFIQRAFGAYTDEINQRNIPFIELSNEIKIFHMESAFKQLYAYPQNDNGKIQFFTKLSNFHTTPYQRIHRIVNTESNVGFDVLNKLLKRFSLETFPTHWEQYAHPNSNLKDTISDFLRIRNAIGHGGDISSEVITTHESYMRYKNLTISLMYEVNLKMTTGLSNNTFRSS